VDHGYHQYFCPISRGAEVFATRWTPVIIRNLLLGCTTYSEIQAGAPGIPRSLLSDRLVWLERMGIVERRSNPQRKGGWLYQLTPAGLELEAVCEALGVWGARWMEASPTELDPTVLLWAICKAVKREEMPDQRVCVRVSLRDAPTRQFWLLIQRPEPEVCTTSPGYDDELVLVSDTDWLARWYMGHVSLGSAMRANRISIDGPRDLVRGFTKWAGVTPFAGVAPAPKLAAST
jgi:DNA-binding HxlR family transcriptional regulator